MPNLPPHFDWRRSRNHLLILGRFRAPNLGRFADCRHLLNETSEAAIERFVRDGALVSCNLAERIDHQFRAPELKEIVRRYGHKPPSGKAELVSLASTVAYAEMESATRGLLLHKCTRFGMDAISAFEHERIQAEADSQVRSHQHLLNRNAKEAYSIFVAYHRGYMMSDYSGRGDELERLDFILNSAPKAVGTLGADGWRQLRAAAAMKTLWSARIDDAFLPEDFVTPILDNARAVRLVLAQAHFKEDVAQHAEWCKKVRLCFDAADVDLCSHCQSLDGTEHTIGTVPELPTEHCTSRGGCVCRLEDADDEAVQEDDDDIFIEVHGRRNEGSDDVDPVQRLRQLKQLLDEQLIESAEYEAKKKEILARM